MPKNAASDHVHIVCESARTNLDTSSCNQMNYFPVFRKSMEKRLKAPYTSKTDIVLSKNGIIN